MQENRTEMCRKNSVSRRRLVKSDFSVGTEITAEHVRPSFGSLIPRCRHPAVGAQPPAQKEHFTGIRTSRCFLSWFLQRSFWGCICADWIMTKDPAYMDLLNCNVHPGKKFLFGTDTMGRDIFSMIWSGGRISLTIGVLASLIAAAIAIFYGAVSGRAPPGWMSC
ncbi:MAG: hypothetical protein ACLTF6_10220 [Clostridium sp.]